jgi:hypothetical protein
MAELKHVGRVKATNKKCLVAYRTLPGDAYSCLIVPTENLPDIYHDSIINLVESGSGQDSYEFAEALARSQFPDGSTMLPSLHATGRLIKAPTSDIEMTPTPGSAILLSELNQIIAEQRGVAVDDLAMKDPSTPSKDADLSKKPADPVADKTTKPAVQTTQPTKFDSPDAEAKYYRSQADALAKQAAEFRRKAETLVPTVKKKVKDTA